MGKFEFRDRTLKLDIAGNVFEIDSAIGDEMVKQKDALVGVVKEFQAGKKSKEQTIAIYAEYIDKVLGGGAFKKIFAKRIPDLLDCIDVVTYIANEIGEFNRKSALTVVK